MVADFREAEKHRIKRENQLLWIQGQYFYEALCDVSPVLHAFAKKGTKVVPYRDKPYSLFDEDDNGEKDQEQKENNETLIAKAYMHQMMRAGKNWGKGAEKK